MSFAESRNEAGSCVSFLFVYTVFHVAFTEVFELYSATNRVHRNAGYDKVVDRAKSSSSGIVSQLFSSSSHSMEQSDM